MNKKIASTVSGHIQRRHPGIAVSVKTRQAIRSVLNRIQETIHELRADGLLDKDETCKLDAVRRTILFDFC